MTVRLTASRDEMQGIDSLYLPNFGIKYLCVFHFCSLRCTHDYRHVAHLLALFATRPLIPFHIRYALLFIRFRRLRLLGEHHSCGSGVRSQCLRCILIYLVLHKNRHTSGSVQDHMAHELHPLHEDADSHNNQDHCPSNEHQYHYGFDNRHNNSYNVYRDRYVGEWTSGLAMNKH